MEIFIGQQGNVASGRMISSGSVVIQGDAEIRMRIVPEITVAFSFESTPQGGSRTISELQDPNTLRVRLQNCGSPTAIASGNSNPIRIGTLRGQDLYVNYVCQYVGTEVQHMRIFSYAFFVAERN